MEPRYFTAEQTSKIALGLLMEQFYGFFVQRKIKALFYNSHKWAHSIKFQSFDLPNKLIANLSGPYKGKRDDSTMSHESGLLSRIYRGQYWNKNQPLCIYGDPAYPSSFHLQAPCSRQNLIPNQVNYNKEMSQIRVSVEWLFNEIKTYLKFVSYTNICLLSSSP